MSSQTLRHCSVLFKSSQKCARVQRRVLSLLNRNIKCFRLLNSIGHHRSRTLSSHSETGSDSTQQTILTHTRLSYDHMTPEIGLYLITPDCPLWSGKADKSPWTDPFWAIYWPGGQVLTRYILDNPDVFRGQRVLDVGSGCGASAIACVQVGASHVIANDVDPVSIEAIKMNAKENDVTLSTNSCNLIGQQNPDWDTILLGDMFYDEEFTDSLARWLIAQVAKFKTNVFISDPGRHALVEHPIKYRLTKVAEYELSETCKRENNGMLYGYIWQLDQG